MRYLTAALQLLALSATFAASAALAQNAQTIIYDANGRVTGVVTAPAVGNATVSTYALDDANNRAARAALAFTRPPIVNKLAAPYTLVLTQKLTSANGQFSMTLDPSGDLVIRNVGNLTVWRSCTDDGQSVYARVASDGRLGVYGTDHVLLWVVGAAGNPGAELTLENTGVAVLRTTGGATLWSSTVTCS